MVLGRRPPRNAQGDAQGDTQGNGAPHPTPHVPMGLVRKRALGQRLASVSALRHTRSRTQGGGRGGRYREGFSQTAALLPRHCRVLCTFAACSRWGWSGGRQGAAPPDLS